MKCHFPGAIRTTGCVVVGSGASAFNAALSLARLTGSAKNLLIVTEGRSMGTSRNTGSDKQTYYKLSTGTNVRDSVLDMAKDYFSCGSMHGDLALTEAAGSLRGFFRLVSLGVPFPEDRYGEYTGYKTDHDPRMRASSCGPLTSKLMTEALEAACERENIPLSDNRRVIRILTENGRAAGIVTVGEEDVTPENPAGVTAILAGAVVWATGGPSSLYAASVYPESQTGSLGVPMLAGAEASNLIDSQYGIASVDFRWNLSGSYQQVLPRYISIDRDGVEREFLPEAFHSAEEAVRAEFLKGYQWPFDPSKTAGLKVGDSVSSEVDIAVYREREAGREVYLDFRRNPSIIDERGLLPSVIGEVAYQYLAASRSLGDTPIRRLREMNEKAYRLYLDHGIDLETTPLRSAVCAQHMNGGLSCTAWYESPSLPGLYPVGECAGVFGVRRPGGSALNSTQVSAQRAAEKIAWENVPAPVPAEDGSLAKQLEETASLASRLLASSPDALGAEDVLAMRREDGILYDECAAFLRNGRKIAALLQRTGEEMKRFSSLRARDHRAMRELFIHYDTLSARYAVLSAIAAYLDDGGASRGSFLVEGSRAPIDERHAAQVLETGLSLSREGVLSARCRFVPVRPIPVCDNWFENVYNDYDTGARFGEVMKDNAKKEVSEWTWKY